MEEKNINKKAYTFSDVLIIPKYSEIESRKNVDISAKMGDLILDLPVVSANMKTVTGPAMAIAMSENGGMGVLHRFCSIDQAVQDFMTVKEHFENRVTTSSSGTNGGLYIFVNGDEKAKKIVSTTSNDNDNRYVVSKPWSVGVSVGVQDEDKERFVKLYEAGARIFFIDIAHGFCKLLKDITKWIREQNLKDLYVVGGNAATADGAYSLVEWGVDAIKCGIGPGSACLTRKNAGVGVPQLYALETIKNDFVHQGLKNPIIADGGMSSTGDIAKALKFADAVMLGGMLAGTTETPGSVFTNDKGEFYKTYMGSASGENKVGNSSANEFIEGIAKTIIFRGHVKHVLRHIRQGLQSAFSYVGANNLQEFQEKCEFIEITSGGKIESKI